MNIKYLKMNRKGIITFAHLHVYFLEMKGSAGHIYPLTQLKCQKEEQMVSLGLSKGSKISL